MAVIHRRRGGGQRHHSSHTGGHNEVHHTNHHHRPHKHATPQKNTGYGVDKEGAKMAKEFNKDLIYVQGFRAQVSATSSTPVTVALNSTGRWLHGIAVIPTNGSDLSDVQITLVVNNNNVLSKVGAENANPGYTQGQLFFPTPQPLFGTDTIVLTITNNGGGTVTSTTNFFYVPRV